MSHDTPGQRDDVLAFNRPKKVSRIVCSARVKSIGPRGPKTSWLTDPDGYRIELVEWPPGHPDGITAADFS